MSKFQRYILAISILGSFVSFLDGSVVNVALPAIARNLGTGLTGQQWVVDSYMLTLGSLILIAGSFSDIYGRKKVLMAGLLGFGLASLLCAFSLNIEMLVLSRAVQGIAGALLVPSSLALIMSNFKDKAKSKAIGTWTGWTGLAFIVGPLLGGSLVEYANWRLIFLINVVPIAVTLYLLTKIPSDHSNHKGIQVDYLGAVIGALGLFAIVFGLIEDGRYGLAAPIVLVPILAGLSMLAVFFEFEKHTRYPMLPLSIFNNRNFSAGNLATIAIYAALSVSTFTIVIFLQQVADYTPLEAGLALLPVTLVMFCFSPLSGKLAGQYGPRFFMTVGPLISALGFFGLLRVGPKANYVTEILPVVSLFAVGLVVTVSPLTSAVLGAVRKEQSGIASAINNAVARIAGLVGVASISLITGTRLNVHGLHEASVAMSILLIVGGLISLVGIVNSKRPALLTQTDFK